MFSTEKRYTEEGLKNSNEKKKKKKKEKEQYNPCNRKQARIKRENSRIAQNMRHNFTTSYISQFIGKITNIAQLFHYFNATHE